MFILSIFIFLMLVVFPVVAVKEVLVFEEDLCDKGLNLVKLYSYLRRRSLFLRFFTEATELVLTCFGVGVVDVLSTEVEDFSLTKLLLLLGFFSLLLFMRIFFFNSLMF